MKPPDKGVLPRAIGQVGYILIELNELVRTNMFIVYSTGIGGHWKRLKTALPQIYEFLKSKIFFKFFFKTKQNLTLISMESVPSHENDNFILKS